MNYDKLADAWLADDRSVLDALEPAKRRAISLVACGASAERELEAAGREFVLGIKSSGLFRRASYAHAAEKSEEENTLTWVISDESVNRGGDILRQNWELENYLKNPVVLWGHGMGTDSEADVPIAKMPSVKVQGTRTVGKVTFAVEEYPRAAQVYRLARGGYVNAGSPGFIPKKITTEYDEEERAKLGLGRYGVVFERAELLEFSICAVPQNPNAIRQAVQAGTVQGGDAEFLAAISDPTEREWEKLLRRRARSHVSMSTPAPAADAPALAADAAVDDNGGGALFLATLRDLSVAVRDLANSREDDAASRRMLARSITDLGGRLGAPRAGDPARHGADAAVGGGLTAAEAEKLRQQFDALMKR